MTPDEARVALETITEADLATVDEVDDADEALVARLVDAARSPAGRPSLTSPGRVSPQITLRLPESTNERLAEVARRTGRKRSAVVREALETYLARA
ncbi:MAG: ribbon-helix-helix domain-containing protein [bacterium]|jgi:hypothetical protein|nr:ribbon-helix-helix domain-containing protein [bacterium]